MSTDEDLVAVLRNVPLFGGFDDSELEVVAAACEVRDLDKGVTLWEAGEPGDEFLIVVSGELSVWGRDAVVARLGPGSGVGEIALMLGEPRSAKVSVSRPARVLVLGYDDFQAHVRSDRRAVLAVGEMLSRRLQVAVPVSSARDTLVVAVVARPKRRGASLVAAYLRERFAASGSVLHIEATQSGQPLRNVEAFALRPGGGGSTTITVSIPSGPAELETLGALAGEAATSHGVVIVDLSARCGVAPEQVARFADVVIDVAGDEPEVASDSMTRIIRVRSGSGESPHPNSSAEPVLLPGAPEIAKTPADAAVALLVERPHSPLSRALDRLVRLVEGRVVGVALGSGAAFGLAHIGVLKALEEAGVPIDVLAGSSMGAVVAIGYGSGAGPGELERVAGENSSFRQLVATLDLALTGDGLLAGRRLLDYLRPFLFDAQTFDDLCVPARAVATDLATGERVAIGAGPLESAVRASIAMPPFVAPVVDGSRTLVDGGIADPVPCDVVRAMGADIVIGVNVVPLPDPQSVTVLTQISRGLNRVNPFARLNGGLDRMNVIDLLMNSLQVSQHHLAAAAGGADVWVRPRLNSFTWIDFYRAPEIIELGHAAGRAAVDDVQRCIAGRGATFMSRAASRTSV